MASDHPLVTERAYQAYAARMDDDPRTRIVLGPDAWTRFCSLIGRFRHLEHHWAVLGGLVPR
jgi:hypothetical protein